MSKLSRENSVLKMKGAGDGVKNLTKSADRVPFRSSKKFTPTLARDANIQLRLKKVIDDMEAKQGMLKKSKSVAEITPTKSRKRSSKRPAGDTPSTTLHATPRPPPTCDAEEPPSGRVEKERRLQLLVYRRMLVFVWRRSKTRLAMVSESLRRRQDQINNLEQQVDCLKKLTHSECHKRGEAVDECQKLESVLQSLRNENNSLIAEKLSLQTELENLENKILTLNVEVENMKNEMNTKNIYIKRLESEIHMNKANIKKMHEENFLLEDKVKTKENEIKEQEEVTGKLNRLVRELEMKLNDSEKERNECSLELNKLKGKFMQKSQNYVALRLELNQAYCKKEELTEKIKILEDRLSQAKNECHTILLKNEDLEKKLEKVWWKNVKEAAVISWAVIQNAAYLMLPAMYL